MRVAVVGLGEAGSIYATDLLARGARPLRVASPEAVAGRGLPARQWRMTRGLAAYSCGNSRSFTLRSLSIPFRGT